MGMASKFMYLKKNLKVPEVLMEYQKLNNIDIIYKYVFTSKYNKIFEDIFKWSYTDNQIELWVFAVQRFMNRLKNNILQK